MTIGIARRFGRRVLIATDTMITDHASGRANAIPGRLKAIVLSPTVSVAFAGHADPALEAIRRVRRALVSNSHVSEARAILEEACRDQHSDVEFIFVAHEGGVPSLRKITARGATGEVDQCFIGDASVVGEVLHLESQRFDEGTPEYEILAEEHRFNSAFSNLFFQRGVNVRTSVGGVGITLLASPYGHTYQNYSAGSAWDTIDLAVGLTEQHLSARRSGTTEWKYSVYGARLRGLALVGLCLTQVGTGYVYSPLEDDEPECVRTGSAYETEELAAKALTEAVMKRMHERAESLGGGVDELAE